MVEAASNTGQLVAGAEEAAGDSDESKFDPAGKGLCLSGGGYRAMLFHLGALRRMNEAGLLRGLARISSVSGGSITAGVLGVAWNDLAWDEHDVASNFTELVETPVLAFAGVGIDLRSVLLGGWPGRIAKRVSMEYAKQLFGTKTLQDLPDDEHGPRFVFCSTNLGNAGLVRFSRPYMADWRLGRWAHPKVSMADAVTASSAFPPVLSPFVLALPNGKKLTLTDGGVYDNLGVEPVLKRFGTVFVSDGGGTFGIVARARLDWARGTRRVLDVLDAQVRRLRRREVMSALTSDRKGAFWAINTDPAQVDALASTLPCPSGRAAELATVKTRLKAMPAPLRHQIANWGYAVCDGVLRQRFDPDLVEPAGFPYPDGGLGEPSPVW